MCDNDTEGYYGRIICHNDDRLSCMYMSICETISSKASVAICVTLKLPAGDMPPGEMSFCCFRNIWKTPNNSSGPSGRHRISDFPMH